MNAKPEVPPPLPGRRTPGWWDRNWKWLVPVLAVGAILVVAGLIFSLMAIMRSSDAYSIAVARAKSSTPVANEIGTPIDDGFIFTGSINVRGRSGKADLAIPIHGPKGKATIYVDARKADGEWHFDHLIVQVSQTGHRIDLAGMNRVRN
jgi:hypothetical protein